MGSQLSAKRPERTARFPRQISPQSSNIASASPPFPSRQGKTISIGQRSEGLLMTKNLRWTQKKRTKRIQLTTREVKSIDILPDDILLGIFDSFVDASLWDGGKTGIEAWQLLVHVCRRWRCLVLGSPRRLNLQLCCTPARDTLDVWPALPLIVEGNMTLLSGMDNTIAALRQNNRVCEVFLRGLADWQLEKVLATMQVPFPELTELRLSSHDETAPVIPNSFLGGSVPRLRIFMLSCIPFPGLPTLLVSATHLVQLRLTNIPHSGYVSPEAMVALLCALSNLGTLSLRFQSPQSHPDWETRSLPPPKRSILPALDDFHFKGVTEYLEDVVTFIDAPRLDTLGITFFNQIDFVTPRLAQFINRTPKFTKFDEAYVEFNDSTASISLRYRRPRTSKIYDLKINVSCRGPDWQLSSIEQVCNSPLHPISTVEDLYIESRYPQLVSNNDLIENTLWLQLLLPFTAVKKLYLSQGFAPDIAAALKELVGDRTMEVLPSLQDIFVEGLGPWGPFHENIGQFVSVRRHSGSPIAISVWK